MTSGMLPNFSKSQFPYIENGDCNSSYSLGFLCGFSEKLLMMYLLTKCLYILSSVSAFYFILLFF